MSNRLNQEREKELQPERMRVAIDAIKKLNLHIETITETTIVFVYNKSKVTFHPYSGWHTGKTIRDGRGLENLLKQLK